MTRAQHAESRKRKNQWSIVLHEQRLLSEPNDEEEGEDVTTEDFEDMANGEEASVSCSQDANAHSAFLGNNLPSDPIESWLPPNGDAMSKAELISCLAKMIELYPKEARKFIDDQVHIGIVPQSAQMSMQERYVQSCQQQAIEEGAGCWQMCSDFVCRQLGSHGDSTILDLSSGALRSREVIPLLKSLQSASENIVGLNLADNSLQTDCVRELKELVKNKQSIESIDLSGNRMLAATAGRELIGMLKESQHITELLVANTLIPDHTQQLIAELLRINRGH
jgi:hypothetical protein